MRRLFLFSLLSVSGSCLAQADPCAIIGWGGTVAVPGQVTVCTKQVLVGLKPTESTSPPLEPILLAMQIELLRNIVSSQQALTASIQALAAATTKLSQASDNLVASNVAWRQNVLNKAIAEINSVPVALAQNAALTEALTIGLADRLANDPAFRKRIQEK